ncbi:hypothetical protein Hanom_Chr14g01320211 [Helianthus anomalus]
MHARVLHMRWQGPLRAGLAQFHARVRQPPVSLYEHATQSRHIGSLCYIAALRPPPTPSHARACERVLAFTSTLSVCFHETRRMKSSNLNTPFSFISPPMWDKMSLFQFSAFNVSNTKF